MNPCGRAVDWIQFPFEVTARLHRGEGAPTVRLRWLFTSLPWLPKGTQNVVTNRIWNQDQIADLEVGQLPLYAADYVQDARWILTPGVDGKHMCHPEWFASGEPWPNDLPPTVYDVNQIPLCCGLPVATEVTAGAYPSAVVEYTPPIWATTCCAAGLASLGVTYTGTYQGPAVDQVYRYSLMTGSYTLTTTAPGFTILGTFARFGPDCAHATTVLAFVFQGGSAALVVPSDGTVCVAVSTGPPFGIDPTYTVRID